MIANLFAVPAFGQLDLVDNFVALAYQVLHLRFGLLLATAETDRCKAQIVLVRVVVLT